MTKLVNATFTILLLSLTTISKGQTVSYSSHYIEKDQIKKDTLVDKKTGYKFIIDKKRIYVTAIDKTGKVIWKTDPAVDNKLDEYRVKRPTIVYFDFASDGTNEKREIIWITYNNSQFGFIDKKNGKFDWRGQD